MDFSFDIENEKGDHILVALSNYDHTIISAVTDDPDALDLCFYDVSFVRKSGTGMVGYKVLMSIARILADFLQQQEAAVLCFYCDGVNVVYRHHMDVPPQQYRSQLFSRMFDMYVRKFHKDGVVNYPVVIVDENPWKSQFAHFICRDSHLEIIKRVREILMVK